MEKIKSIWSKILVFTGLSKIELPTEEEKCAVVDLVKNTYDLYEAYKKANEDMNITLYEWGGIAKKTLPVFKNIRNWEGLRSDIKDFTFGKGRELKEWIISKGILKDDAEETISHLFDYVEYQFNGWVLYGKPLMEKLKKLRKNAEG